MAILKIKKHVYEDLSKESQQDVLNRGNAVEFIPLCESCLYEKPFYLFQKTDCEKYMENMRG